MALGFWLNCVDNPSEQGDDGHHEGAGQSEEKKQQQDPSVAADFNVLTEHFPGCHLKSKQAH